MNHTDYFANFLENTVNLPKSKLMTLSARVDSIYDTLESDEILGPRLLGKVPQGSWPQKTIINPQNAKAFDADFMIEMVEEPEWADDLKLYGNAVYDALNRHSPYKDMPNGRKCRCVYVRYADNAMHVDMVPFVRDSDGKTWIIDRDNNRWERTDPEGLTDWMRVQDGVTNGHLREVIRIVKFLRDHRNSFTGTKSVLLTTMLGERVDDLRAFTYPGCYSDLPTALLRIVSDLDVWLQAQDWSTLEISDPAGTGTSFKHRWSENSFEYFRDRIHTHAAEIAAAYDETDFDESVRKWQALFGSGFTVPVTSSQPRYSPATTAGAGGVSTVSHSGRAG